MTVTRLLGVYNADGGIVGELRYVIGHARGTTTCGLCDITHGRVRRKPAFDAMTATVDVPFDLTHRNELDAHERAALTGLTLPIVVAERPKGTFHVVCDRAALDGCDGDVDALHALIVDWLATHN